MCVCLSIVHVSLTGALGVTKWAWVGHGVSRSLQREIQSATTDEDTVRVIASRSHAGDVFTVAESGFMGYKKVQRIIAAGSGYKALQVSVCVCVCVCVLCLEWSVFNTQKWQDTCPHKCEWLTMEGPNNVLLFQWLLHYLL